jgi:hypothetical protein
MSVVPLALCMHDFCLYFQAKLTHYGGVCHMLARSSVEQAFQALCAAHVHHGMETFTFTCYGLQHIPVDPFHVP